MDIKGKSTSKVESMEGIRCTECNGNAFNGISDMKVGELVIIGASERLCNKCANDRIEATVFPTSEASDE